MDAEAYADILPWLVFVVIERKTGLGLGWAGGCAAVVGLGLAASSFWRGRRAPVARLAVVLFAVLCAGDFVAGSWTNQFADTRAVAMLVLSGAAFASLRFTPLSAAYTAMQVAPGVEADPRFRRVNVEITRSWGLVSLLVAVSYATADLDHSAVAMTFLNWVVPLGLATATVIWASQRWQRFRLEVDGDVVGLAAAEDGPPPRDLGAWVEEHDAVVHRLPASGQRNV